MNYDPGDLVKIKESGKLAIIRDVFHWSGPAYELCGYNLNKVAWYYPSDLELIERGHYQRTVPGERKEAFNKAWEGKVLYEHPEKS